jgi:hypothetical protein
VGSLSSDTSRAIRAKLDLAADTIRAGKAATHGEDFGNLNLAAFVVDGCQAAFSDSRATRDASVALQVLLKVLSTLNLMETGTSAPCVRAACRQLEDAVLLLRPFAATQSTQQSEQQGSRAR